MLGARASPVTALRLGLIGAGRWGRIYIRSIASMENLALAAVASSNPQTEALLPPGCRQLGDWRALIALPEVEAVIVATPPSLHFAMAKTALLAGNPKPSDSDINSAMNGNICRCATYIRIRAAIHEAARIMEG